MLSPGATGVGLQARTPRLRAENGGDKVMNFRQLVQQLEDRIGYHQIPMNPAATGTRDLFESCPVHHELVKELMQAIYKANGCRQLTDPVRRLETFSALEPIRLQLLRSAKADVDQVELIDNLCSALDEAFGASEPPRGGRRPRNGRTAEIIPLDRFRYRRFRRRA